MKVADQGITELAKGLAQQAVGRLPRVAITRAAVYPIAQSIARVAGMKLTKEGFAKGIGKFIPIAGGLFSGSLTLFTFKPGARRLQKRLKAQKMHFTDGDIDALSAALWMLMDTPRIRKEMGGKARERAARRDKEKIMQKWTELFACI